MVDRNSSVPLARQLYDFLRTVILRGQLGAGERLPPTRTLANQLGIGRNTVIAAYDRLLADGYVAARTGGGTWVAHTVSKPSRSQTIGAGELSLSRRGSLIASRPQPPRNPGKINLQPGFPEAATFPFPSGPGFSPTTPSGVGRTSSATTTIPAIPASRRQLPAISALQGGSIAIRSRWSS